MLGVALLQYVHRPSQSVRPGLIPAPTYGTTLEQFGQIRQFKLLYPPPGE
jgi:hypothetical protein